MPVSFDISRYLTDKYFDIVWGCRSPRDPQMDPPKNQIFEWFNRVPVCFDIRRYLSDKYFDIVWGCHPPGDSPNGPPKNQIFERLNLGYQSVMISGRDGADSKQCIRMLRCVRKLCPHAAPHRIQTLLSSRCTAPRHKLCILQISTNIRKKITGR